MSVEEKKLRVGIFMGGMSSEREVSLESGRNIFNKLNRAKYQPVTIFLDGKGRLWEINIRLLMRNSTGDIEEDLEKEASRIFYEDLKAKIDVACLGLHGKYGEDGCIQGLLELLGIPYTGSGVLASALGMDKFFSRRLLAAHGIDVPKSYLVKINEYRNERERAAILAHLETDFPLPCIVKPAREGCSTGVTKVLSSENLPGALDEALKWDDKALVEEFITGTEVTCGVLEEQGKPVALVPSETIPTGEILSLEDKFLYGQGENKTPARLPEETLERIRQTAVRCFSALDLRGYARIDMFVSNNRVLVLEPNSLPGLTPSTVLFHQAAAVGMTPAEFLDRIIQNAIYAHNTKKGPL